MQYSSRCVPSGNGTTALFGLGEIMPVTVRLPATATLPKK
jgi:hypothetical protein